jgi:hypothetical protein
MSQSTGQHQIEHRILELATRRRRPSGKDPSEMRTPRRGPGRRTASTS